VRSGCTTWGWPVADADYPVGARTEAIYPFSRLVPGVLTRLVNKRITH
jgi:hypothetical protein